MANGINPAGEPNPPSPIPPNADGTCAPGYALSSVDGQCYLIGPPISLTATGVDFPAVDPKNAAELAGLGTADSGLPYLQALAFARVLHKTITIPGAVIGTLSHDIGAFFGTLLSPVVNAYLDAYDAVVTVIASWLTASKTRDNPAFWITIGDVISDLLGVDLNGTTLFNQLATKGTLPAMQSLGGSLINLLIGEFTGTAGGTGGEITAGGAADPATGLPVATLTPQGGLLAIEALMGFVLSSAVRQANIEGLTDKIPYGLGRVFEKYSEAMRTNLGIGRMLRFALRPMFQILAATPAKWAFNITYRPTEYNLAEASRAVFAGVIDQPAYLAEAARLGYADPKALAIMDTHLRKLQPTELQTLWAGKAIADTAYTSWLQREGFDSNTAALIRAALDLEPSRKVALALAEHYLLEYGKGAITAQALRGFIDAMRASNFPLTPGEIAGIEGVATTITATAKLKIRLLSLGQLKKAYIDGTITLQEYEDHAASLGYSQSDVTILGIDLLIDAKLAQAAAAKKAAAGIKTAPTPGSTAAPATSTTPTTPTAGT